MTEIAITAPATYRQPSRKGKKAWRKNVDITEVQTGLDNVREEIIQSGVPIAEKQSDQLFATDLTGDSNIEKQQKNKRLLKADEIIGQRSAVAGLDGRKRKAVEESVVPGGKRVKNGTYVSHKELARLKRIADNATSSLQTQHEPATFDPWAASEDTKDPRLTFLEEQKAAQAPKTLKHAPVSLAANGKRIAAVRKPEAGKSYNPLVSDWSAVLEREGAAAVEDETKRLATEAAIAEQETRALAEAEKVETAERDDHDTDYESTWESEWEGFQSGAEDEVHTRKLPPRKTPSERNKVKARKEREAREKWEKKQKDRELQEKRIEQIAKDMSARDKLRRRGLTLEAQNSSDSDEEAVTELQKRRFGKLDIPDAPIEVVLPDELEDSLRRLKPEGNLLTDRYRNLLVNGKVEVRKKIWQSKQAKKERTEKWSYKDWKLK